MNIKDHERLALVETQSKLLAAGSVVGWGLNFGVLFVPAALAGNAYGVGGGLGFFFASLVFFGFFSVCLMALTDEASKKYAEHKANQAWAAEQERIQLEKFLRDLP